MSKFNENKYFVITRDKEEFQAFVNLDGIVGNFIVAEVTKDNFKEVFEKYGVSTAKHVIMAELDENKVANMPYPLIVKPRWGMGSISILEAENEEEAFLIASEAAMAGGSWDFQVKEVEVQDGD